MNTLFENLQKYVQTHIDIVKLEFQEKFHDLLRQIMLMMALASCVMMASAFVLIALALWINQLSGLPYLGFLVVALLFGIAGFFIFKQLPFSEKRKANSDDEN